MANITKVVVAEEGPRNAVVKVTGVLDNGDVNLVSAIPVTLFANNSRGNVLVGFRADMIEWSMSNNLEITIAWNGNNPEIMYPIAGRGRIKPFEGFCPDRSNAGYDGSINITTSGAPSGTGVANFTIILNLIKLYTV